VTKTWDITLHSDFPPESCLTRLTENIDLDRWAFSLSGYEGSKPIVGRIAGNEFRLHKRRYWHNRSGPVLFGRVGAEGRGSLIEAYWDLWLWDRIFMRVWLGYAVLVGTPIFFTSLRDAIRSHSVACWCLWAYCCRKSERFSVRVTRRMYLIC
jgi:hypothetical protein